MTIRDPNNYRRWNARALLCAMAIMTTTITTQIGIASGFRPPPRHVASPPSRGMAHHRRKTSVGWRRRRCSPEFSSTFTSLGYRVKIDDDEREDDGASSSFGVSRNNVGRVDVDLVWHEMLSSGGTRIVSRAIVAREGEVVHDDVGAFPEVCQSSSSKSSLDITDTSTTARPIHEHRRHDGGGNTMEETARAFIPVVVEICAIAASAAVSINVWE